MITDESNIENLYTFLNFFPLLYNLVTQPHGG